MPKSLVDARKPFRRVQVLFALGLAALTQCPSFGQGGGTRTSTGYIPQVEIDHQQVGVPNRLLSRDWAPWTPLLAMVSTTFTPTPLPLALYGPAVVGPNLASGLILDGLQANSEGLGGFSFNMPPFLAGSHLAVQFAGLDPLAPYGGIALSETRVLGFSTDSEIQAVLVPVTTTVVAWRRIFSSGLSADLADVRLADTIIEPVYVANNNEMLPGRADLPVADNLSTHLKHVALPDGSRLYLVRSTTHESGLVRVDHQRRIQVLVWAQGSGSAPFDSLIAVAPNAPYAALVSETPLSAFGNSQVVLVRIDGRNIPGHNSSAIGLPLPSSFEEPEPESLCFLNGALFVYNDEAEMYRMDLTTFQVSPVVLPPSGGAAPVFIDEEGCGVAENGSLFAVGIGESQQLHDIYVVNAAGVATNLTQLPADYRKAAPGEADGMQLVVSPSGDSVAYQRTVLNTETFVRSTVFPSVERHITNDYDFDNWIDTVVGLSFTPDSSLSFTAGTSTETADVFRVPPSTLIGGQVQNLTQTSPVLVPPFGMGATLELQHRFFSGSAIFNTLRSNDVTTRLQVVGSSTSLNVALGTVRAVMPLSAQRVLLVDSASGGRIRLRVITTEDPVSVTAEWISASAATLLSVNQNPLSLNGACLIGPANAAQVVRVSALGVIESVNAPAGTVHDTLAVNSDGSLVVQTIAGSTVTWWKNVTGTTSWTNVLVATQPLRFLR